MVQILINIKKIRFSTGNKLLPVKNKKERKMKTEKNILIAFLLNLLFSIIEFIGGAMSVTIVPTPKEISRFVNLKRMRSSFLSCFGK